jgi:integrase
VNASRAGRRVQFSSEVEHFNQTLDITFSYPATVGSDDPDGEPSEVVVLDIAAPPFPALRSLGRGLASRGFRRQSVIDIGWAAVGGLAHGLLPWSTWRRGSLTRMLATGCRIGECLAIGWAEVNLETERVDIAWHLVRETGAGLTRKISTKSGKKGERLVPLPGWAVTMLKRRRAAIGTEVEPVFPDSLGGWRDPSNVRRVWREVRDDAEMEGLVSHTLRKTVASFLDDAHVSTRKISDQLGHAKVSMTQDRYLGRRLTDRQTSDVLDDMFEDPAESAEEDPEEDPGESKRPQ